MEPSLIEQMDKTRGTLMKWITIGWGTWYASVIGNNVIHGHLIVQIVFWIGLVGNTIFAVNLIKYLRMGRKVRKDPKLREALEDEWHHFNINRSYMFSYWVIIASTGILLVINSIVPLTALLTAELILYVGILSFFGSSLYYNRD